MNMDKKMTDRGFDISALVDDLQPVQPLNGMRGLWMPLLVMTAILLFTAATFGLRPDLLAGQPAEMFLIRAGILLLLGVSCAHAVMSMACPAVGKQNNGWKMAVAGAFLFPLSAMIVALTGTIPPITQMLNGFECIIMSAIGAFSTAIPMVYWLRKGAPTSPERAGWLVGLASGGLGAFAYNFHCPFNSIVYIGLWYGLAVGVSAVAGRLMVPRLIRW
jgi:hypothetical protein